MKYTLILQIEYETNLKMSFIRNPKLPVDNLTETIYIVYMRLK